MTDKNKKPPAVPDPYDMEAKRRLHPLADELNVIGVPRKRPILLCGAKKRGKTCSNPAGYGTMHPGHGRCKWHGGCSTGPKTEEGKAKAAQNGRTHGLYAQVLSDQEREIFEKLTNGDKKAADLENEIFMQKAKLLAYLAKWKARYDGWVEQLRAANKKRLAEGQKTPLTDQEIHDIAERKIRVYTKDGDGTYKYYHAGTIEDNAFNRALETLGRLVEKHARLNPDTGDSLLNSINQELRAASQGKVSISWGGKAQQRAENPKD